MLCPDHKQYFSKQSANLWASFLVALEKRIMSSVYMTCVMAGPLAQGLVPLILPAPSSLSKNLDKTSCPRMNKYGESGSPCLKPLLGLNRSVLPPLTKTSKDTELMQVRIQLMNIVLNPRFMGIAWMNFQLNLS